MKRMKQGYLDRLHESLGERNRGPHSQSLKSRAHESEGMERAEGRRPFSAVSTMDKGARSKHDHHMAAAHHEFMARHHKKKMHKKR